MSLSSAERKGSHLEPETENQTSDAVALLVIRKNPVDGSPQVWTVRERQTKPATDKRAGQFSIPVETRKVGETTQQTTIAAIAEFASDDDVINDLYFAKSREGAIDVLGKKVDLVVMVYGGNPNTAHLPIDSDETEPYGWVSPDFITGMNGEVRALSHDALRVVDYTEMEAILNSQNSTDLLIPLRSVVGSEFSLNEFTHVRDAIPDIPLT